MRTSARTALLTLLGAGVTAVACHSAPPPPPPVVVALTDSGAAALQWVRSHATPIAVSDSVPRASERAAFVQLAGDARVVGISELTEGTREFPNIVRHLLLSLADSSGVRGLAIQASMADAMEVNRFVRTGTGDPRRLLHRLNSWRWETPEMVSLVNAMRDWNRTHGSDKQIGFYGFEIPTAEHAVEVVNALPDSIAGTSLKGWFRREYGCVLTDESARFGREGRASDSTFWRHCGEVVNQAVDSLAALRQRVGSARGAQLDYVQEMARLIQHHVTVGLRYLTRQDANAEHVLYLANMLGPNARLITWGGDVEMGRLTLDKVTIQTGVALADRLGARYRTIGFLFGDGTVRARPGGFSRNGQPLDLMGVNVLPPAPNTFEDVLIRAQIPAFLLDLRTLPSDMAGGWLRGPRQGRLITELYSAAAPAQFETPLEFPKFFDGVVFVHTVTATK